MVAEVRWVLSGGMGSKNFSEGVGEGIKAFHNMEVGS